MKLRGIMLLAPWMAISIAWSEEAAVPALAETVALPAVETAPAAATGAAAGLGAAAYDELIKENLELRRKIDLSTQSAAASKQQNEQLNREIRDLDQRIREMAGLVDRLKKEKAAAPEDLDRVMDLESQLSSAEEEKAKLKREMDSLKTKAAAAAAEPAAASEPAPRLAAAAETAVQTGSDLFKEVEKENLLLRKRLAEIEDERQKAVREREDALRREAKTRELKQELARAKEDQRQSREAVDKLLQRIPAMEHELTSLQSGAVAKDATLTSREKELETYRLELERRENRIIKAERMADLLTKTRDEVREASEREKRDMHYNMAAVYAKEGKFHEAEQEYLHALRIDPTDADSHYNLGILYDEQLGDKRKAVMHYRRYLKLRPNAPDGEIVKQWLLEIEMGKR